MKQVIIMRRDLKMRRGKEIAQGAHASIAFLTRRLRGFRRVFNRFLFAGELSRAEYAWLQEGFTKVCVRVNSEEELLEIRDAAKAADLEVHLITDSGTTEFHGVPTHTCLAIGPDEEEKIDRITGHLTLL